MARTFVRAVGAAALVVGLSGCWQQARFDAAQSNWNRDEATVTSANVGELTELWSQDLGDGQLQSPLSLNGTIYLVADEVEQATGFAFDSATGAPRWQVTTPGQPGLDFGVQDPVWFDSQIVVPWGVAKWGGTRTFDPATGQEVASSGSQYTWGLVAAGGRLATGSSTFSSTVPTLWSNSIAWRCSAGVVGQGSSLGGALSMAFVGDSLMWADGTRALGYVGCPRDATTWSSTWTTDLGGRPGTIVGIDATHVAYLDDTGTLSVLDATTGMLTWSDEVGSAATPAVADGRLLLRLPDGRLTARDALTGTPLWESPPGTATGTPMAGGDVVYVPAGNTILAFALTGCGTPTCPPIATLDAGSPVATTIIDDGRLIATTTDSRVVVFG